MTYNCTCRADAGRYTLDEAYEMADAKATLDWIPVVKATLPPDPMMVMAEAYKASLDRPVVPWEMPTPPPPIVNYTPPDIHVAAPQVTVDNSAIALVIAELKASLIQPPRRKIIERDENGHIIGMREE